MVPVVDVTYSVSGGVLIWNPIIQVHLSRVIQKCLDIILPQWED